MKKLLQCLLTLGLATCLVACQSASDEEQEDKEVKKEDSHVEVVSLEDWEGQWNSIDVYVDDENLIKSFEEVAERENIRVEEAKNSFSEKRYAEFKGLIIEDDQVTFLNGKSDEGEEITKSQYAYMDSKTVKHGSFETEWSVFEASEENARYPYLLMMPVHGEETLTHFHLRYGDDIDALLAKETWYPTMIKPESSYSQIHEEITE